MGWDDCHDASSLNRIYHVLILQTLFFTIYLYSSLFDRKRFQTNILDRGIFQIFFEIRYIFEAQKKLFCACINLGKYKLMVTALLK